jgi:hypothetical protein
LTLVPSVLSRCLVILGHEHEHDEVEGVWLTHLEK